MHELVFLVELAELEQLVVPPLVELLPVSVLVVEAVAVQAVSVVVVANCLEPESHPKHWPLSNMGCNIPDSKPPYRYPVAHTRFSRPQHHSNYSLA